MDEEKLPSPPSNPTTAADWDGPDDPEYAYHLSLSTRVTDLYRNAQNWSLALRGYHLFVAATLAISSYAYQAQQASPC
jgi:hypothetical protein